MKNSFPDIVENIASLQFNCEESLDQIEGFKIRVNELEGISDEDRNQLLAALEALKPLVIERYSIKALKNL